MAAWINLKIQASAEYAHIISDALIELGALSSSIEDSYLNSENEEALFGEPNIPSNTIWQHNTIESLFDDSISIDTVIDELKTMTGLSDIDYTLESVEEQNWVTLTQSQFEPISILNKLWIVPSWHTTPNPSAINIILDPGLAFGTGSHPTTHLCLEWLIKEVNINDRVLDYGCGSGILSIAAKKCGAKEVVGVDIDPQAILATEQNAALNGVAENLYVGLPDEFNLELADQKADVFVANILAGPLMMLAPEFATLVKSEGEFALAGVIEEQVSDVSSVYSEFFDILEVEKRDENWCRISGKRHTL